MQDDIRLCKIMLASKETIEASLLICSLIHLQLLKSKFCNGWSQMNSIGSNLD